MLTRQITTGRKGIIMRREKREYVVLIRTKGFGMKPAGEHYEYWNVKNCTRPYRSK